MTKVDEKTAKIFTFRRIQSGYWGRTELTRTIKVRAKDQIEAKMIVSRRSDAYKRLRNGDTQSWSLETE